MKSKSDWYSLD